MNFASKKKTVDRKAVDRVTNYIQNKLIDHKEVLTKQLKQLDSVQILVTEVECNIEGCAPIETLVILVGESNRWSGKVLKPIAEVVVNDIVALDIPFLWDTQPSEESEQQQLLQSTAKQAIAEYVDSVSDDKKQQEIHNLIGYLNSLLTSAQQQKETTIAAAAAAAAVAQEPQAPSTTEQSSPAVAMPITRVTIVPMKPNNPTTIPTTTNTTTAAPTTPITMVTMVPMKPTTATSVAQAVAITPTNATTTDQPQQQQQQQQQQQPVGLKADTISASGRKPRINTISSASSSLSSSGGSIPGERHSSKGVRQRGCPCCDPDNIDNIIDKMLCSDA